MAKKTGAATRSVKKKSAKKTAVKPPVVKGLSLHIGLNGVDPKSYEGWDGPLAACEFDAHDMTSLATARGFKPTTLITAAATRAKVLAALRKAGKSLKSGDFFLLTYSGHGGQVKDVTAPGEKPEEADGLDETWCLFDGELIDDELYFELSRFAKGVRVLVLSDSCHSGTVTRARIVPPAPGAPRPRMMPPDIARRVYEAHQAFYDKLQRAVSKAAGGRVADPDAALANVAMSARRGSIVKGFNPTVILISGCQDNQTSMDGDHNGAFTEQLLRIWNKGAFKGNYTALHAQVRGAMPSTQSPNLFTLGTAAKFLAQAPFSI
ncbi:MAG: caspase family protein [Pseudomonadota bacterium]